MQLHRRRRPYADGATAFHFKNAIAKTGGGQIRRLQKAS